jgi:acetyltransferase-like isoleucine patch superfamily enzyme
VSLFQYLLDRLRYHWQLRRVNHLPYAARGQGVTLHNGSVMAPPERIRFGSDIYIGPEARFHADGGIVIADNVIFGPRVTIYTSNHVVEGGGWVPYGPVTELGEVWVGPNVWVGAQSILLAGVRIGEGAVVAAGSVVVRSVPPLALVAGNPAEVKRYRDPEEYLRLRQENKLFLPAKRTGSLHVEHQPRPAPEGEIAHSSKALEQRRQWALDRLDLQR